MSPKRKILIAITAVIAIAAVIGFIKWKEATDHGGQQPAEPFRIAGNLYYVGANDVAAFLITGPDGHILIDGGYPGTAPMIIESVARLGFDIRDVRVLLNSEPHFDHAGGLAELQKASGAKLWASEASADALVSGGAHKDNFLPYNLLVWSGILRYPAPRVDHRFKDGERISVGPVEVTAHITGGHSRGCTSWSFPVRDADRELRVVSACSLTLLPGISLVAPENYPGIRADFERTFDVLRRLPVDIWVTSHAKEFGRYRKFLERGKAQNPADPFIDREGYFKYIDKGEEKFRRLLAEQEGNP
jgi:metallo-beta-lactamase class B